MAASYAESLLVAILIGTAFAAPAAQAPQAPIAVDAASMDVDYGKNEVILRKARISQGPMSVTADQAVATGQSTTLNFDDSRWVFRGNVRIVTAQGQIGADEADATFLGGEMTKAVVTGKPAVFEQTEAKNGKPIHGHADVIDYQVGKGVITLSKDAWLTTGSEELHAEFIGYNLLEKKLIVDPAEQNSRRVHIKIPPPPPKP
jgi:lipopolysaccharide transport protein LptA